MHWQYQSTRSPLPTRVSILTSWYRWPGQTTCYLCCYLVVWRGKKIIDILEVQRTLNLCFTSHHHKANHKRSFPLIFRQVLLDSYIFFLLDWSVTEPGTNHILVYVHHFCFAEAFKTLREVGLTSGGCRLSAGAQTQPAALSCSLPDTMESSGTEHTQLLHASGSTVCAAECMPEDVHCGMGCSSTVQNNHSSTERFLPKKGELKKKKIFNIVFFILWLVFFPTATHIYT